jgi:transcriptional regulator with XRE-family HTH domain
MKKGVSQKEAAKQAGVSAKTLRRFQKANTTSQGEDRRWVIADTRPVSVVMASRAKCAP